MLSLWRTADKRRIPSSACCTINKIKYLNKRFKVMNNIYVQLTAAEWIILTGQNENIVQNYRFRKHREWMLKCLGTEYRLFWDGVTSMFTWEVQFISPESWLEVWGGNLWTPVGHIFYRHHILLLKNYLSNGSESFQYFIGTIYFLFPPVKHSTSFYYMFNTMGFTRKEKLQLIPFFKPLRRD